MSQKPGFVVWLTGMSGSGKSTLAQFLCDRLNAIGRTAEIVDQDIMQPALVRGPGLSKEDRMNLTRRLGWGAGLIAKNGGIALVAATSPYREAREVVRREVPRFIEVYCDCPTEVLIERDKTGQYKKALSGALPNFTGVTDPYETPQMAEATAHTDRETIEESTSEILRALIHVGYVSDEEAKQILGTKLKKRPPQKAMEPLEQAVLKNKKRGGKGETIMGVPPAAEKGNGKASAKSAIKQPAEDEAKKKGAKKTKNGKSASSEKPEKAVKKGKAEKTAKSKKAVAEGKSATSAQAKGEKKASKEKSSKKSDAKSKKKGAAQGSAKKRASSKTKGKKQAAKSKKAPAKAARNGAKKGAAAKKAKPAKKSKPSKAKVKKSAKKAR